MKNETGIRTEIEILPEEIEKDSLSPGCAPSFLGIGTVQTRIRTIVAAGDESGTDGRRSEVVTVPATAGGGKGPVADTRLSRSLQTTRSPGMPGVIPGVAGLVPNLALGLNPMLMQPCVLTHEMKIHTNPMSLGGQPQVIILRVSGFGSGESARAEASQKGLLGKYHFGDQRGGQFILCASYYKTGDELIAFLNDKIKGVPERMAPSST
eukprot:1322110-Amorphochlora_amoeboformis.AAC.1